MTMLVKDLKEEQVFYEYGGTGCRKFLALENARRVQDEVDLRDGWACDAIDITDLKHRSQGLTLLSVVQMVKEENIIEFFQDAEVTCYGPKIYEYEAYVDLREVT